MADAGVVGGALAEAGLGLMRGLMGPSWEEEKAARALKFEKEQEELTRLRAQTKLDEARALYEARRGTGALRQQFIKDKAGNVLRWDPDAEKLEMLVEAPTGAAKLKDQREAAIMQAMVARMGGRPMEEWTPEEITGPILRPYWRLLGQGGSPYTTLTDKGDVVVTEDYLQPGKPPPPGPAGTTPAPTTTGGTPPATTGTPAATRPQTQKGTVFLGKATPEMEDAIAEAHRLYPQVRPELIRAVMARESNYNPYVRSPKGAEGLMQLMPATGEEMGVTDPFDVKQNVIGGTRYLAQMLTKYGGSEAMALAAYNAGPGRFDRAGRDLTKLSTETQAYVPWVLARAGSPGAQAPTAPPSGGTTPAPGPQTAQAPGTAPTRPRNVPLTPEAQRAEDQRVREAQIKEEEAARAKREALEGKPSDKQSSVANDLFVTGRVASPNYPELSPHDKKLVDDTIAAPELEKAAREAAEAKRKEREPVTRALSQTMEKRLEELDKGAMTATKMDDTLGQIERLITSAEGVYGNTPEAQLRMGAYATGLASGDQRARNTAQLRNLASQLQLAPGSLGSGVSVYDAQVYAKAAGDMQKAQNVEQMLQYMEIMRAIIRKAMRRANEARTSVETTGKLPEWGEEKVATEADIQRTMRASGKSREEVIEALKKKQYRVP